MMRKRERPNVIHKVWRKASSTFLVSSDAPKLVASGGKFLLVERVMAITVPWKVVHGRCLLSPLLPAKSGRSSHPLSMPLPEKGMKKVSLMRVYCQQVQVQCQQEEEEQEEDVGIMCDACNGQGWLTCDFCEGQKINVKAANNRIYRRCPSCKAVGYLLCQKCKVFKCVTFPDYSDGEL